MQRHETKQSTMKRDERTLTKQGKTPATGKETHCDETNALARTEKKGDETTIQEKKRNENKRKTGKEKNMA